MFIPLQRIFMLIVFYFAAFCLAFKHQNAVRFAAFQLVFSTKMHCVLPRIALHFAANSPKTGANSGAIK